MSKFVTINWDFISEVETLRSVDLKIEHVLILSIVNSYNRQGKTCSISRSTFGKLCRCDAKTISRRMKDLIKWNMINVHIPKHQAKTQESCITHIHKDLKQILINLAIPSESTGLYPQSPKAAPSESTYNKKIPRDSKESSLEEDSFSSQPEKPEETFLASLIEL